MNWSDERYVRVYTRDTRNWKRMGWQARCLLVMLMRKVDRAGVFELEDGWTYEDLAEEVALPVDIVHAGLHALTAIGSVTTCHATENGVTAGHAYVTGVTIPNFLEAQDSSQSDAARQRSSRECRRAKAIGGQSTSPVAVGSPRSGNNDDPVTPVTAVVTNCHSSLPSGLPSGLPSLLNQPSGSGARSRARDEVNRPLSEPEQNQSRREARKPEWNQTSGGGAATGSVDSNPQPSWKAPTLTGDEISADEARELSSRLVGRVVSKLSPEEKLATASASPPSANGTHKP